MKKITVIKILSAAVLLQSCGSKYSSEAENLDLASNSFANSYTQDSGLDPRTDLPAPISLPNNPVPALPTQPVAGAPTAPSQPQSPHPAPAPAPSSPNTEPIVTTDCSDDVAALGWSGLNNREKVNVSVRPIDNFWAKDDGYPNEIYAYGGMGISFENPYRIGSRAYFRHAPNYTAEGYKIQIKDHLTGLVVQAQDADLSRPHVWSAAGVPVMGFIKSVDSEIDSNKREQYNFVTYQFSRSLYDKIKNFKNSSVSLYCKNVLISEGTQDIQALSLDMARTLVKVGTYQGASLYSYPANTTTGYVSTQCPLEVIAGTNTKCTAGGLGIASGYWLVDGQSTQAFTGISPTALDLSSLSRGAHSVQLFITYSNGVTTKSLIHLLKIK